MTPRAFDLTSSSINAFLNLELAQMRPLLELLSRSLIDQFQTELSKIVLSPRFKLEQPHLPVEQLEQSLTVRC